MNISFFLVNFNYFGFAHKCILRAFLTRRGFFYQSWYLHFVFSYCILNNVVVVVVAVVVDDDVQAAPETGRGL